MHRRLAFVACVTALGVGVVYGVEAQKHDLFPVGMHVAIKRLVEGTEPQRPGLWARARDGLGPAAESDLGVVPYLGGYEPAPLRSGVTRHDRDRAFSGFNLLVSGHAPEAILMDMEGRVLHRWEEPEGFWPEWTRTGDRLRWHHWRRAHVYPNGDLLAVHPGVGIMRLDRDSRVIWSHLGRQHHDLSLDDEGRIHTLTRIQAVIPRINPEEPITDDQVTVLGPEGEVLDRFSFLECLEDSRYAPLLLASRRRGDIFHTNTIQWLDGSSAALLPAFARGNLLISVRNMDTIAVVDPRERSVVWALTGAWRRQHEPVLLPTGRMLLFDNKGAGDASRVIEFDPLTQEVHWEYRGSAAEPFYSKACGSNERLPNGNTLIAETGGGRALEVTPEKEIVWEYLNPKRAGDELELIAALFEIVRLPPDFPVADFVEHPPAAEGR